MTSQPKAKDSIELILGLFRRDIERHYGGRTVGKTLTGDEAAQAIQDYCNNQVVLSRRSELARVHATFYEWTDDKRLRKLFDQYSAERLAELERGNREGCALEAREMVLECSSLCLERRTS